MTAASKARGVKLPPPEGMATHAQDAAELLRCLANPHRLLILCVLGSGELPVNALNASVPLSQSALSQHLAVLRESGLVDTRREAQTIYYAVRPGPALELIHVLHAHFCSATRPSNRKPRSKP